MNKTAVVLFNLGGPDELSAVRPFLFNLFSDRAIIRIPAPFRQLLAFIISTSRAKKAKAIYAQMGGRSPIVPQTSAQAHALEEVLAKRGNFRVFFSMRYWHPRSHDVVDEVKEFAPDRIVLLPLYPQFSSTTTASSVAEWHEAARAKKLRVSTTTVCCYPGDLHFAAAYADATREAYFRASQEGTPRILFSAHGLPKKIVDAGDPYVWQVEQSVKAIIQVLGIEDLDYVICYQSRVGPMEWVGPATDAEICRGGMDRVPLVVVPVAFVSEHSETRVELDIEYAHLAKESGVPHYVRVPALSTHPVFIEGLAELVIQAMGSGEGVMAPAGAQMCPARFSQCMCYNRETQQERKAA